MQDPRSTASKQSGNASRHPGKRTARTPQKQRDRYLRQLYVLLTLIALLLLVMTALIPDYRDSQGEPSVGTPEPGSTLPDNPREDTSAGTVAEEELDSDSNGSDSNRTVEREEPPAADTGRNENEHDSAAAGETDSDDTEDARDDTEDAAEDTEDAADDTEDARGGPEPGSRGHLYFVLDDAGYSTDDLRPFLDIGVPITVSVLPHLEHSDESAQITAEAGQDVLLHMPMEPVIDVDPGPGAIYTGQEEAQIRTRIGEALDSVPEAIGANNHMGSAVTGDREAMQAVMDEFYGRDLFFLDSLTNASTVVPAVAASMAVPYLRRHVFVDHERDETAMREALDRGIRLAEEEGVAVLIGHVQTPGLPRLLEEAYDRAVERGVAFEGLSHLRDTAYLVDARN